MSERKIVAAFSYAVARQWAQMRGVAPRDLVYLHDVRQIAGVHPQEIILTDGWSEHRENGEALTYAHERGFTMRHDPMFPR